MSYNRKFVIFDLDGTLIDSYECVLRCVNKTLNFFELPSIIIPASDNTKNVEDIFGRAKEITQNIIPYSEFKSKFDSVHLEDCINDIEINIDAENLMCQYFNNGYTILILTNKLKCIADKICNHFFSNINVIVIGREDVHPIKSNWQYIVEKLSNIDICPGACELYVGDSDADEYLAKSISIKYLDIHSYQLENSRPKTLYSSIIRFIASYSKIFNLVGKLTLILGLITLLYTCFITYVAWNKIPSHTFNAFLSCEGYSSKNSYCNLRLQIDAGSTIESETYKRNNSYNLIQVYNSDEYNENIPLSKFFWGKCSYLLTSHTNIFFNKISYYFLDFDVTSNIKSTIHNKEFTGVLNSNDFVLSYIENPKLFSDSLGTHASGSGILGFCKGKGGGDLQLYMSLLNSRPTLLSPWNVEQSNYAIIFKTNHIKCDTISIEFKGATDFSNMYPTPDKTTVSSIEFYDSEKILEIAKNGLRFHTDFIELREMGARRTFMLSGFVSLLISLLASILLRRS